LKAIKDKGQHPLGDRWLPGKQGLDTVHVPEKGSWQVVPSCCSNRGVWSV
jgi:hypothetical protein